jgi:AcrR family transcriptional regulator
MSSETAEPPLSARERILSVAGRLFYRDGYRATGIDRVIAEADVAKATFYKHFSSKDDLILTWIARSEAQALAHAPAMDGPAPLTDYALAMIAIAARPTCLGCTYQATAAEFGASDHPAHVAARGVKDRVLQALEARARLQGFAESQQVAEAVFLLLEGVWATRRMYGSQAPIDVAARSVQSLIAAFGRGSQALQPV